VDDTGTVLARYDFLCPSCYLGQHRNAVLTRRGLRVIDLPFAASGTEFRKAAAAPPREALDHMLRISCIKGRQEEI
jgi:predicted DsbA family dithiol-disulfide isomerase